MFLKNNRLPGAAVGVATADGLVWSTGVGFADLTTAQRPNATTLFRIASVTKTFTAAAVMQLRSAGQLALDDPVVEYLPELRRAQDPFGPISAVTVGRMLYHRSGLVAHAPGTDFAIPHYEGRADRILDRAEDLAVVVAPGTEPKYSNVAYGLLGEVVARVSRTSYPEYVQRQILKPLGLSSTAFEPLSTESEDRRARGYKPRSFSDDLEPAPEPPRIGAEGGLWSTVTDLARWLAFQLAAYRPDTEDSDVLDAATRREMHTPRYLSDPEGWARAQGIAWSALRRDGVTWVQHSGGIHGFTANVCFDPSAGIGAVALINGSGDAPGLAISLATAARDAIEQPAPITVPPRPVPNTWLPLLGLYANDYACVRLEWSDGALTFVDVENPAWRVSLSTFESPDVFVVAPGSSTEHGEKVVFKRLTDGQVASVLLGSATLRRLGPVGRETS
jgi:CubicO group peptidase (beta-lactamase class C family)